MKRRKPILEFQNSKDSPFHASKNTPGISSLVCYSEDSDTESSANTSRANLSYQDADLSQIGKPTTPWQACVDKNTGYSYYWNVETNQVTWNPPEDYLAYQAQVEEWKTQRAANNARFEELSEIQQKTGKPIFAGSDHNSASDSDSSVKDDKIELISAYGPASDDESDSEHKDTSKTSYRKIESYESKFLSSNKTNQSSHNSQFSVPVTSSIIPSGSNINHTGVKNNSSTCSTPSENISNNTSVKQEGTALKNNVYPWSLPKVPKESSKPTESNTKLNKVLNNSQYDPSDDDDEDEDDEGLDDLIIGRLRKKAMLLKQLGGEVPQEILSVFDHTKTAEDIIAEIEKEIPVDSLDASVEFNNEVKPFETSKGDKSDEAPPPKPLFPILDYVKKEEPQVEFKVPQKCFPSQKNKMKIVQKIKLSARAKELIRTSLLTAKARATNFVETEDGLKPAEEVKKLDEQQNLQSQASESNSNIIADDPEDTLLVKNDLQEIGERLSASSVMEDLESKKSPPTVNYFNLNEEKKAVGLGTKTEEIITKRSDLKVMKNEPSNDGKYDFQTSFMVYNSKQKKDDAKKPDDIKNASLWSKCEEFLKSELNRPEIKETDKEVSKKDDDKSKRKSKNDTVSQKFNDIDIDEVLDTKNENEDKKMNDLSQLIMEKLKFLSAGKNPVSSVQVMTIQIETLVGAWQNGALTLKYLADWLDASLVQLKSFEEAAAPKGWHCEWDRSYGRYYYRNKATGSIQWDYPDCDDRNESSSRSSRRSSRRSSHSRPRTPPPPVISDMVPPPPPVISDRERESRERESRRRRSSPRRDSDRRRRDDIRSRYSSYSSKSRYKRDRSRSRSPVLPPLPPTPPKSATPPPPPPPSSPPPPLPPPPPVTATESETNLDKCTTVTPMEIENDDEKPIKMHDELDSFYSDIASIEASFNQTNTTEQPVRVEEPLPQPPKPQPEYIFFQDDSGKVEEKVVKKKKKVKLDSGLSLKKKGLETLVAKWQKVNSDM